MTSFTSSLNKKLLQDAITSKAERVLFRTGAYALTTIRRSIRPAKKPKTIPITVKNRRLLVPPQGKVLDAKTKQPVPKRLANAARRMVQSKLSTEGAGKPPRRGPSDKLRTAMKFVVDKDTYEVTAGPIIFSRQPKLVGVSDVPELLEGGGSEYVRGQLVQYQEHPFVEPAIDKAKQRMAQLTDKERF